MQLQKYAAFITFPLIKFLVYYKFNDTRIFQRTFYFLTNSLNFSRTIIILMTTFYSLYNAENLIMVLFAHIFNYSKTYLYISHGHSKRIIGLISLNFITSFKNNFPGVLFTLIKYCTRGEKGQGIYDVVNYFELKNGCDINKKVMMCLNYNHSRK